MFKGLFLRRSPEGEPAGAGGGAPDLLDPPAETPPAAAPPAPASSIWGEKIPEFPEGFDKTLIEQAGALKPFLKDGKFNTANIMKSYIHAQSLVGRDKIAIPRENSTEQEWNEFHEKVFKHPSDPKEYVIERAKESSLDDKFFEGTREQLHKLKVPMSMAKGVMEHLEKAAKEEIAASTAQRQDYIKQGAENLKKDWGEAYNRKIAAAQRLVKEVGGEATAQYLKDNGLSNDPGMIRFLAEIGEKLFAEGKIRDGKGGGGGGPMTPAEIDKAIGEIRGDSKHPFNNPSHPNNKQAQMEMLDLYERRRKVLAGEASVF